jgi:hypothetical protein
MTEREKLVDRIALFLATNYPCDCGDDASCSEEPEADAIVELMEAAGYGPVKEAGARALRDAADLAQDRVHGLDGSIVREREKRGYMQSHNTRSAARWLHARADELEEK